MSPAELVLKLTSASSASITPLDPTVPTLRVSFIYQWRAVITATSLLVFGGLFMFSPPRSLQGSLSDMLGDSLGWLCFVAAVLIRLWATLYLGGNKGAKVICEGPYSMCRNPLYIGTLLIVVSQICFHQSLTFALGLVLPLLVYVYGVVPAEEHYLSQKLGDEYLDYCARVPRWWPRFSQFTTSPRVEFDVHGVWRECLRIKNWIWLPFLAEVAGMLQEQPWWPYLFNCP